MNKVLIITYYWPPSGGAGVQRWLKFSKYLPEFGWQPVILTVDPEFAAYPAIDNSLETEISPELKIYKTRATDYFRIYNKDKKKIPSAGFATNDNERIRGKIMRFIRGNFFIPDPRKGWNKYAFRKACEIISTEGIKHVITTSPPHSTQLIGFKIRKKYPEVNWIADLRDPWTEIYYYKQFYPTFISKRIDSDFEKKVLEKADRIITVGPSLKTSFSLKVKGIADKIKVITNGFDEDDFAGLAPSSPDIFTISYIGTLSDAYPIEGFLDALHSFKENRNEFRLRFIGTVSPAQKDLILSKTGNSIVEFISHIDHRGALKYMVESTVLLLIIPDHSSNRSILTGKLFEYIAAGKPVICLGPADGDAAEIIKETGNGNSFMYDDISGIKAFLFARTNNPGIYNNYSASGFTRKNLTSQLVKLLSGI